MNSNLLGPLQVLVVYLGDMRWKWLPPAGLLPFQKHRQDKVAEAEGLIAAKSLTKPILFHKALKVRPFVQTCLLCRSVYSLQNGQAQLAEHAQGAMCLGTDCNFATLESMQSA